MFVMCICQALEKMDKSVEQLWQEVLFILCNFNLRLLDAHSFSDCLWFCRSLYDFVGFQESDENYSGRFYVLNMVVQRILAILKWKVWSGSSFIYLFIECGIILVNMQKELILRWLLCIYQALEKEESVKQLWQEVLFILCNFLSEITWCTYLFTDCRWFCL